MLLCHCTGGTGPEGAHPHGHMTHMTHSLDTSTGVTGPPTWSHDPHHITHSLGNGRMGPEVVFLHKETGHAIVMEEEVRLLHQSQFPLSLTRIKHSAHHIKRVLQDREGKIPFDL